MQRMPSTTDHDARPGPTQSSRSFTRYEPQLSTEAASSRYYTSRDGDAATSPGPDLAPRAAERSHSDIFEVKDGDDEEETAYAGSEASHSSAPQETLVTLPIEIRNLVERFLEALPTGNNMSIDHVADHFQAFYTHAQSHINTHIAAQQSRLSRAASPSPSASSMGSASSRSRTRPLPAGLKKESQQQMLTAEEISNRKKARRQLEQKRIWIEEAIERYVCEQAYPHIWANPSSDDVTRDAKLKSRAAALALVGVTLQELLSTAISSMDQKHDDSDKEARRDVDRFAEARRNLQTMNDSRSPQAKLQALSMAHKEIVDALQQLFPSSSSADEILPTLIFVVISSHPETLNLVSDLFFIQRFRNVSKLGGETAYCLTNLEAAIGFLETVDLSSLRGSEVTAAAIRDRSDVIRPSTSREESASQDPLYRGLPLSPQPQSQASSPRHSRRLSALIGARPQPLPGAVIAQADNAIDAIHTALDSSFSFLFGRMKEKQLTAQNPGLPPAVAAPKTLAEARELVTEKSDTESGEEDSTMSHDEASTTKQSSAARKRDATTLIGGRRVAQDKPRPTNASGVANTQGTIASSDAMSSRLEPNFIPTNASGATAAAVASGYAAVESMRTLGDSLNPFKTFSMRGFGRPGSSSAQTVSPEKVEVDAAQKGSEGSSTPETQLTHEALGIDVRGIGGPIERFVDLTDARELNFFDTELLLRDYQRLAGVLKMLQR